MTPREMWRWLERPVSAHWLWLVMALGFLVLAGGVLRGWW